MGLIASVVGDQTTVHIEGTLTDHTDAAAVVFTLVLGDGTVVPVEGCVIAQLGLAQTHSAVHSTGELTGLVAGTGTGSGTVADGQMGIVVDIQNDVLHVLCGSNSVTVEAEVDIGNTAVVLALAHLDISSKVVAAGRSGQAVGSVPSDPTEFIVLALDTVAVAAEAVDVILGLIEVEEDLFVDAEAHIFTVVFIGDPAAVPLGVKVAADALGQEAVGIFHRLDNAELIHIVVAGGDVDVGTVLQLVHGQLDLRHTQIDITFLGIGAAGTNHIVVNDSSAGNSQLYIIVSDRHTALLGVVSIGIDIVGDHAVHQGHFCITHQGDRGAVVTRVNVIGHSHIGKHRFTSVHKHRSAALGIAVGELIEGKVTVGNGNFGCRVGDPKSTAHGL